MIEIHPTACVASTSTLLEGARIGPYCIVGEHAVIGEDTVLEAHVVIGQNTVLGGRNHVFSFACLGTAPQDFKYRGESTRLEIGSGNIIREYVTMNIGTPSGRGITRVGDGGMFMANSHVGHDCIVGNRVVLTNSAALAGHVEVGDGATLGGLAGVHQFARVGTLALVAAGAMAAMDVPPFSCVHGDRARLIGLNMVGLRRAGTSDTAILGLKRAYRLLFRSGLTLSHALDRIQDELEPIEELTQLVRFVQNSKRGICRY